MNKATTHAKQGRVARTSTLLILVSALVYVMIAVQRLLFPGLHFDELLHVNAALGGLDSTFVYKSLWGVPILLMPYIGSLKAALAAPIFALFGVSPLTIRLPLILVAALALLLLGRTLQRWVGRAPAALVCLVLALDPTFISLTRADSGPVVVQFALSVVALAFFERYRRVLSLEAALGLWLALGLLVFNKLNGIWVVNAFTLAALLVYGKQLWRKLASKPRRWHALIHILGYGACAGYYLLVSWKFNLFTFLEPGRFDLGARIANLWSSFWGLATGELFYDYAYGSLVTPIGWIVFGAVAVALIIGVVRSVRSRNRDYVFFALAAGLIALQVAVTRNAVWPWHYFSVYPFVHIALVVGLRGAFKNRKARLLGTILGFGFVVYAIGINAKYVAALGKPTKNVYWTPAIYDLYTKTESLPDQIVSIDWGTHTQLLSLSQDPGKYKNESFFINRRPLPSDARTLFIDRYLTGKPSLFILHTPEHTLFPSARTNFFELSQSIGLQPVLTETIKSGDEPIFELYVLTEPTEPLKKR